MCIHRNVTAVEHQVRPKGLGLGADRSLIKDLEPSKHKQPPKPGDERVKEEELVMGPGSCVIVESGPHKDKYGKVELSFYGRFFRTFQWGLKHLRWASTLY